MTDANTGYAGALASNASLKGPRVLLVMAAVLELLIGLGDWPILLGDRSQIPGPGLGGAIITAKIVLQPLLATAVLVCVATGRMRYALFAMAALIFMTWLSFLPSVAIHGLEFRPSIVGLHTLFQIIAAPVAALAIVTLAAKNRLVPATWLAILPSLVTVLGVVAFAIGVALYGF